MEMVEYEKFVKYRFDGKGCYVNPKRRLEGKFKVKGSEKIHSGDNFMAWNIHDDAFESYRAACEYFNYTLKPGEKERIPVSAKWVEDEYFE